MKPQTMQRQTKSRPTPDSAAARPAASVQSMAQHLDRLRGEVKKVVVGKEEVIDMVVVATLTEGAHILFEDVPGLAKSVLAATFSKAAGCKFNRIQFTPDLLPTDITGGHIYNRKENEFEFRRGPLFTNFLLADEINRASPKTQSALLEAMAENQVSVEGVTHALPPPFLVLATQNPVEQEGTYPLPEAQMDRFSMRLSMGYPSRSQEAEIMNRRLGRGKDGFDTAAVLTADDLRRMRSLVERIHVSPAIVDYIAAIVDLTRQHPGLAVGASPRGSLALVKLSRALAALKGRSYVIPDDVRRLAGPALAHRVILTTDARVRGTPATSIIEEVVAKVPIPREARGT